MPRLPLINLHRYRRRGAFAVAAGVALLGMLALRAPSSASALPAPLTRAGELTATDVQLERTTYQAYGELLPLSDAPQACGLDARLAGSDRPEIGDVRAYESPVLQAPQQFNAVAFQWNGSVPRGATMAIAARFSSDGAAWSDWLPAEELDQMAGQGAHASDLIFASGPYLQYRVQVAGAPGGWDGILQELKVIYIDSSQGPTAQQAESLGGPLRRLAMFARPNIIGRAAWGANEAYRIWDPEYAPVKKIVIHHTATSNAPADPAAAIRSIYYYHAVIQGWGDIGYNFIIDPQGRVYEGRYGGSGVIAAHAYGYNRGSIGIAMLGTFEDASPSEPAMQSLQALIASKALQYGIDPRGRSMFIDKDVPNVIGHRDLVSTACPGAVLYGQLPNLRTASAAALPPQAQSWGQDSTPLVVNTSGRFQASVTVTNIGTGPWPASGPSTVRLGYRWRTLSGAWMTPAQGTSERSDLPRTVNPGETITLTAVLQAPADPGAYALVWDMQQDGTGWFSDLGNSPLEKTVVAGSLSQLPNETVLQLPNDFFMLLPVDRMRTFPLDRLTLLSNTQLVQMMPDIIPLLPNDRVLSFSNDILIRYLPDARLKTFSLDRIKTFPLEVQQRLGFAAGAPGTAPAAPDGSRTAVPVVPQPATQAPVQGVPVAAAAPAAATGGSGDATGARAP